MTVGKVSSRAAVVHAGHFSKWLKIGCSMHRVRSPEHAGDSILCRARKNKVYCEKFSNAVDEAFFAGASRSSANASRA